MILILKHIDIEGPGTLGDFFKKRNEPFRIIELGAGESLPPDLKGVKAVVVLGGPMNVYEEDNYSFLKAENDFIQCVLKREIPFLGICLGSQLLAKAAGAKVIKSPVKEIGWYTIQLTEQGKQDPFLKGFKEHEMIFHWHEDMFEVPPGAELLAVGTSCPHQAMRVGKNAYGIQFHVEITDLSIREWCAQYCRKDSPDRTRMREDLLGGYARYKKQYDQQAEMIFQNFMNIVSDP